MKNIMYLALVLLLVGCSSLENNSVEKIENFRNNKKIKNEQDTDIWVQDF